MRIRTSTWTISYFTLGNVLNSCKGSSNKKRKGRSGCPSFLPWAASWARAWWGQRRGLSCCPSLWQLAYLRQRLELMHGEVREEDDHIVLHTDDQAGIPFVAAADHTHVIALKQQRNLDHKKFTNNDSSIRLVVLKVFFQFKKSSTHTFCYTLQVLHTNPCSTFRYKQIYSVTGSWKATKLLASRLQSILNSLSPNGLIP